MTVPASTLDLPMVHFLLKPYSMESWPSTGVLSVAGLPTICRKPSLRSAPMLLLLAVLGLAVRWCVTGVYSHAAPFAIAALRQA